MRRSKGSKAKRKKRGLPGLSIFTGKSAGASGSDAFGDAVQREALRESRGEVALQELEELGVLGEGAQGVVKKVRSKAGDLYALKQRSVAAEDEEAKRSILREVRALKNVGHHACVVTLCEAYFEGASVFLLMELVDGGSLRDLLGCVGGMPEGVVGKVCCQVLEGLRYLHEELKLVHRDIKPANLLVSRSGHAKIADFGVSGHLANTLGMADTFLGATAYMSPERIKGQPHGASSDVWSLGLVVLECALGHFPIQLGENAQEETTNYWAMWQKICNEEPPTPPASLAVTEAFGLFCARCLVKEPEPRALTPELLEHEWIARWRKDKFSLKKWMLGNYSQ